MGIRSLLNKRPHLRVNAQDCLITEEPRSSVLVIGVTNAGRTIVRVTDVYARFAIDSPELIGSKLIQNVDVPLTGLAEGPPWPLALGAGETVGWSVSRSGLMERLRLELRCKQRSHPKTTAWLIFAPLFTVVSSPVRWLIPGDTSIVVRDGRGNRHRASIAARQPPFGRGQDPGRRLRA